MCVCVCVRKGQIFKLFTVSAQDGITALGNAHALSCLSAVPSMLIWLNTHSQPQMVEQQPLSLSYHGLSVTVRTCLVLNTNN